jgi:hypothetical protein
MPSMPSMPDRFPPSRFPLDTTAAELQADLRELRGLLGGAPAGGAAGDAGPGRPDRDAG